MKKDSLEALFKRRIAGREEAVETLLLQFEVHLDGFDRPPELHQPCLGACRRCAQGRLSVPRVPMLQARRFLAGRHLFLTGGLRAMGRAKEYQGQEMLRQHGRQAAGLEGQHLQAWSRRDIA